MTEPADSAARLLDLLESLCDCTCEDDDYGCWYRLNNYEKRERTLDVIERALDDYAEEAGEPPLERGKV